MSTHQMWYAAKPCCCLVFQELPELRGWRTKRPIPVSRLTAAYCDIVSTVNVLAFKTHTDVFQNLMCLVENDVWRRFLQLFLQDCSVALNFWFLLITIMVWQFVSFCPCLLALSLWCLLTVIYFFDETGFRSPGISTIKCICSFVVIDVSAIFIISMYLVFVSYSSMLPTCFFSHKYLVSK